MDKTNSLMWASTLWATTVLWDEAGTSPFIGPEALSDYIFIKIFFTSLVLIWC